MSAQVKDFISKCSTCNEYSYKQPKEPLLNHSIPTRPWSKLAIDLFVYNNVNYVILVDYFSDFWEVAKLNDTTSSSVIEFCKQQFSRHGISDILVSDNSPTLNLFYNHHRIDVVRTVKYLGIILDNQLLFKQHIKMLESILSRYVRYYSN